MTLDFSQVGNPTDNAFVQSFDGSYRPQVYLPQAERASEGDPVLDAMAR